MTKSELDELNKDGFFDWFAGFSAGEGERVFRDRQAVTQLTFWRGSEVSCND